jgi:alpha-L-arabinofuranosidase
MKRSTLLFMLVVLGRAPVAQAEEATIRIDAKKVISRVTRYMTGACIEDVNHEIYGGIYSQMIFGENFQELALPAGFKNFKVYGGHWQPRDGLVSSDNGPGPKLIADHAECSTGELGVEVFLSGRAGGVAGLIVNVRDAGVGADKFTGYEISLSSNPEFLILGRHRQNWEPLKKVPCAVPAGRWIPLIVRLDKASLEILVNSKSMLKYKDRDRPLEAGRIGLRSFLRPCRFRNLWVKTGGQKKVLPFIAEQHWDAGVSGMWRGLRRGTAAGRFKLETNQPFIGTQCQRIEFQKGRGEIGIENNGLNRWGMYFVPGKSYEGYVWMRADEPTDVFVALESGDGSRCHAQARLTVSAGPWRKLPFTLTPEATGERSRKSAPSTGRFALKLTRPGSILVGHAFLQPGPWGRFKDLPVRRDVAEGLVAQGLTVLRYGGSMVNAPEYRWKKMIGPRDRRPPYKGTWYPYSSNGWGILDFLDLCEAAGFLAIPAFNMDETPQDMADFVEYVNGPAASRYGKKRVGAGHPRSYRLRYLELGNEEAVNEAYWKRFKPLAEAIWAKDPHIILVVGDFAYNGRIKDPFSFPGAPLIKSLQTHKKILELAKSHGRPIWFDVHVWNNDPRHPDELGGGIIGLRDFGAALKKLCPAADFKVCVFEENSGNHALRRGLAHAHAINELERSGDLVPIVCAANCLQPYRQNDNGWDQGMLFLTPSQVWGQPPYYVTQMIARNYLPQCVRADVKSPGNALDVTAKTDKAGKRLQLQIVNLESKPVSSTIWIEGFSPPHARAHILELAGRLDDVNTPEKPQRITPRTRSWQHEFKAGRLRYTFPPYSFTLLCLK